MYFARVSKNISRTLAIAVPCLLITGTVEANQEFPFKGSSGLIQLAQASTDAQESAEALTEKGNQLRDQGKYGAAIETYREAEKSGEGSEILTNTIADTYLETGREREAYWEYYKLRDSADTENRMVACERMEDLKYARSRYLKDPYFADLYTNVGWQNIGDAAFFDAKGRFGASTGGSKPFDYYLFAALTRDNRSGIVGDFTEEYFDNVSTIGAGVQKKLLSAHELYFIAEAGAARELEDFGRDRNREDYRAGFEYYKSWNTGYNCRSQDSTPNRFILSINSDLTYYSRYDDAWLFNIEVRPGVRIWETRKSNVDAFLQLSYNTNLKESDNNYSEVGFGISWMPDRQRDFYITARVNETFFDDGDSDTNYIIELEHYISW